MALAAGARPANMPKMLSRTTAPTAVQKPIWKCELTIPSVVFASSASCKMTTAKSKPLIPDTAVSRILSLIIWLNMLRGVAPIARRMPISVVRSLTVTIMILDTPIAPASKVPMPTSQI